MMRPIPLFDSLDDRSGVPVRTTSGVRTRLTRTNLTAGPTPLIGRRAELDALRELVTRERCVSVVGPPGVGKTRLARECAVRLLDEFIEVGGAWVVDVSRARDEAEIAAAITRAIDVETQSTLGAALAAQGPMLVMLDDATDCTRDVVSLLDRLGREAPEVRWLVTSRVRLEATREAILELGGMTLPLARLDPRAADSVQLFIERAREVHFGWSVDDASAIAAIVRAVEGNALAIEIAAAWMRSASLAEALERVTPRRPDEPRRLRNEGLRTALAAAWELASTDERRALTKLATLRGGFDPDTSDDILDVARTRDVVEALAVQGLLARRGERHLEVARAVREGLWLRDADGEAGGGELELPAGCVAVCARGTWFRTPDGPIVSITRWLALRNLLIRISEHREIAPDDPLSVDTLIMAGWPGERILPKAGATRLYTALSTLRRLGLRRVLLRRRTGYLLDPNVPMVRVSPKG